MQTPWLSLLISAVTGGLMGAIANIAYSARREKALAQAKENATVGSLIGELRRTRALCEYNGKLKTESTTPFVRFPTSVALRATFEERHAYPRLRPLLKQLEDYTMALLHISQLMELHDLLWLSSVPATGVDEGAQSRRGRLQHEIADFSSGQQKLKGVGPEGFVVLPSFIDYLAKSIEDTSGDRTASRDYPVAAAEQLAEADPAGWRIG
jgi:hypothetical protein